MPRSDDWAFIGSANEKFYEKRTFHAIVSSSRRVIVVVSVSTGYLTALSAGYSALNRSYCRAIVA